MKFFLSFTPTARQSLKELKADRGLEKRYRAVVKALERLAENPRHPGLRTHKYHSLSGPKGKEVFEAYAEQDTPAAYRVFFFYGSQRGEIVVFAITPHP